MMMYDLPEVALSPGSSPQLQPISAQPVQNAAPGQMEAQGKALLAGGIAASDIGTYLQNKLSDAFCKEGANVFSGQKRSILYDPEKGYFATKGKNALLGKQAAEEALDDAQQKVMESLAHDPVAQAGFYKVSTAQIQAEKDRIAMHAMQETQAYYLSTTANRADQARQDAIVHSDDWNAAGGQYDKYRKLAITEAGNVLDSLGIPATEKDKDGNTVSSAKYSLALQATTTKIVNDVVDQKLSLDTTAGVQDANEYFKAAVARGDVLPDQSDNIRKKLNGAVDKVSGQVFADKLYNDAVAKDTNIDTPVNTSDLITQIRATPDSELSRGAKHDAEARIHDNDRQANEKIEKDAKAATNQVMSMLNNGIPYTQIKAFIERNDNIGSSTEHSLKDIACHYYGIQTPADLATEARHQQQWILADSLRTKFLNGELGLQTGKSVMATYGHQLGASAADLASFVNNYNDAAANQKISEAGMTHYLTTFSANSAGKDALGFDGTSHKPDDLKKKALLTDEIQSALRTSGAQGKPLTFEQAFNLAITPITVPRTFIWDLKIPRYMLREQDTTAITRYVRTLLPNDATPEQVSSYVQAVMRIQAPKARNRSTVTAADPDED